MYHDGRHTQQHESRAGQRRIFIAESAADRQAADVGSQGVAQVKLLDNLANHSITFVVSGIFCRMDYRLVLGLLSQTIDFRTNIMAK